MHTQASVPSAHLECLVLAGIKIRSPARSQETIASDVQVQLTRDDDAHLIKGMTLILGGLCVGNNVFLRPRPSLSSINTICGRVGSTGACQRLTNMIHSHFTHVSRNF